MDRNKLKSNQGFTIVELIVSLVLVSMVLLAGFQLLQATLQSFRATNERVDAQSQFRLIVDILEKEVGTATSVLLMEDPSDIPDPMPDGYAAIYAKTDGDVGKFYKRTRAAGEVEYVTPYPLKELTMIFERATSKNIMTVYLHARVTNDYTGNIYTQNSSMINVDPGTVYTVVYYKPIDPSTL